MSSLASPFHRAPLAFAQCFLVSYASGEIAAIAERWPNELSPFVNIYPMFVVCLSGVMSFSLNICSLQANKVTSPLTLCIAANVKQVLMIVLSTVLFHVHISPLNGAGILVVLAGSARYSYVSVLEKQQANKDLLLVEKPLQTASRDDDETETEMSSDDESDVEEQRLLEQVQSTILSGKQ